MIQAFFLVLHCLSFILIFGQLMDRKYLRTFGSMPNFKLMQLNQFNMELLDSIVSSIKIGRTKRTLCVETIYSYFRFNDLIWLKSELFSQSVKPCWKILSFDVKVDNKNECENELFNFLHVCYRHHDDFS